MSIVTGYPVQNDREIDLQYERESERMWEAANSDEEWDRKLEAVGYINVALEYFDKLIDRLIDAKDEVEGIPAEYRIGSILEGFEDLGCDLRELRQRFIEGR